MKTQPRNDEKYVVVRAEERRQKIMDILSQRGAVTVQGLGIQCAVAPITIRRNLKSWKTEEPPSNIRCGI